MTQYLLSVHIGPRSPIPPDDEIGAVYAAVDAFNDEVRAAGRWVFAGGLQPIETATTVDATGETPITTDGAFVESKEYLGGFWVIEADDIDDALAWAIRGSAACRGPVEVRAFEDEPA